MCPHIERDIEKKWIKIPSGKLKEIYLEVKRERFYFLSVKSILLPQRISSIILHLPYCHWQAIILREL
jgi:hypothetical protein